MVVLISAVAEAYPQKEFPIERGIESIDAIAKKTTTPESLAYFSGIGSLSDILYTSSPNGIASKRTARMFAVLSRKSG